MKRTYSELVSLKTFKERFEYLKIGGRVGEFTFGPNRFINQRLYHGQRWLEFKDEIIIRDKGCDLAMDDRVIDGIIYIDGRRVEVHRPIYVHHLNPICDEDILEDRSCLYDPENVVCCSFEVHEAIHYGDYRLLKDMDLVIRRPNDTIPWRA